MKHYVPLIILGALFIFNVEYQAIQYSKLKKELGAQKSMVDTSDYDIELTLADKEMIRKAKHIVIYGEDKIPIVIK